MLIISLQLIICKKVDVFYEIKLVKFSVCAANHYNLMTEFWVADTPPNADTSRCIKWSYNEGKVEFRIELVTGKNTSSSWGVNSSATIRVRKDSHHWHLFTLLFTIRCAFDRFNYILLITLLFKGYNAMQCYRQVFNLHSLD